MTKKNKKTSIFSFEWIDGARLMMKWDMRAFELRQFLQKDKLPVYEKDSDATRITSADIEFGYGAADDPDRYIEQKIPRLKFKTADVLSFEKKQRNELKEWQGKADLEAIPKKAPKEKAVPDKSKKVKSIRDTTKKIPAVREATGEKLITKKDTETTLVNTNAEISLDHRILEEVEGIKTSLANYMQKPGIAQVDIKTSPADAKANIGGIKEKKEKENFFCREGNIWEIGFKGKSTSLVENEKLLYIPYLLENPGQGIHSMDLIDPIKKKTSKKKRKKDINHIDEIAMRQAGSELIKEGYSESFLDIDIGSEDLKAIKEITNNFAANLKDAEKNKKKDEIIKARDKFEKARRHFLNVYSLKIVLDKNGIPYYKKYRLDPPELRRAKDSVRKQINRAINDIEQQIPSLGEYLRSHIHKGKSCKYQPNANPDEQIDWHIDWG